MECRAEEMRREVGVGKDKYQVLTSHILLFSVPGQPHGVRLIVASSTSIHISWHEPQDLGDGIFGYEVYYNKSSKDMDTNVGASNGLNKNIMGLTPYTVYKFGVAAKSDKGIGPMSFAVTARTREDGKSLNLIDSCQ